MTVGNTIGGEGERGTNQICKALASCLVKNIVRRGRRGAGTNTTGVASKTIRGGDEKD